MQTIKAWSAHNSFWLMSYALISMLLLYAIASALPYMPEPIGSRSSIFIAGAHMTIMLSISSGVLGLLLGLCFGLIKLRKKGFLFHSVNFAVWILRGTPLLTQLLFVYYVIPIWMPWLKLNEFSSAVIALAFNMAAYNADVIKGAILAVPKGQFEAGYSLGLSRFRIMYNIIFPQAIKICSPALVNNFIALIKDSSLASGIGLLELTLAGTRISSETFDPLPILVTISLIYLGLTTLINLCMLRKKSIEY